MDLHCEKGGPEGMPPTALNAPIFEKVWETVIQDGHFRAYDWIVKADPDTMFIPDRIRQIIRALPEDVPLDSGVLLKNCKLGLHGPIEVLSRRALEIYSGGNQGCDRPGQEDVFIESCLTSLGVYEHMQENVLAEGDCIRGDFYPNPTWYFCNSNHASFHPLKSVDQWRDCLHNAEASTFAM